MRPPSALALVATLVALVACQQGGRSRGSTAGSGARPPLTGTGLPTDDPRTLRYHRVDMLIAQWDVAQAGGRCDQAAALFQQIRSEVDGALPDFLQLAAGAPSPALQYLAVGALGFSSRPEATRALVDRLADRDADLVGNALIALKLRADPETPLASLIRLVASPATPVRRYAPLALANVVDARYRQGRTIDAPSAQAALHVLSGVVADRDPYVRLHAAKALGALRTPAAYELLMIQMKDEEVRIRLAAAAGLERTGNPGGFPEVIRLLDAAPEEMKPAVRDLLASYAERMRGQPLPPGEVQRLGTSSMAWSRWFNDFRESRGITVTEGRDAGLPTFPAPGR